MNELSIDGTGPDGGRGQVIKEAFVLIHMRTGTE